jgi:hypothetical protein
MSKKLNELRLDIGERLVGIEDLCRERGLKTMTEFTLIARDPDNDNLFVVVTSESLDKLPRVFEVALRTVGIKVSSVESTVP